MARIIKFRAWDKRHNSMEVCHDLYWFEENYVRESNDANSMTGDWVIMQYTGLKDRNGVEIYEGDICKVNTWPSEEKEIRVVTYLAPSFYLSKTVDDKVDVDLFSTPGAYEEVIGNIYENPELLNGNKE